MRIFEAHSRLGKSWPLMIPKPRCKWEILQYWNSGLNHPHHPRAGLKSSELSPELSTTTLNYLQHQSHSQIDAATLDASYRRQLPSGVILSPLLAHQAHHHPAAQLSYIKCAAANSNPFTRARGAVEWRTPCTMLGRRWVGLYFEQQSILKSSIS